MTAPWSESRPAAPHGQGSGPDATTPAVDRIRDNLAVRCTEAEAQHPESLDLAARVIAALHGELTGCASEPRIRGWRPAKYHREALQGHHAETVEDLARYALEAPRALVAALRVLARAVGYSVDPLIATPVSVGEAAAGVIQGAAGASASIHRAQEDGRIDSVEAVSIAREVEGLERRVVALKAALARTHR